MKPMRGIFDETYRVIAVEGECLTIRGEQSGEILRIVSPDPAMRLTPADYPLGKLIALSDPSTAPAN